MGGRQGGWRRGEAAVALETTEDLRRQPPLLGTVVRLLNLRGVAEQQQRQSGQLPPAPNRIGRHKTCHAQPPLAAPPPLTHLTPPMLAARLSATASTRAVTATTRAPHTSPLCRTTPGSRSISTATGRPRWLGGRTAMTSIAGSTRSPQIVLGAATPTATASTLPTNRPVRTWALPSPLLAPPWPPRGRSTPWC